MIEQINEINRSLQRINVLLQDPAGSEWPARFRLLELPSETAEEGREFIRAGERVAALTNYLNDRVKPRLEERAKRMTDQFIHHSLSLIEESVQRRGNGGHGLTRDVLDKARLVAELIRPPETIQQSGPEPSVAEEESKTLVSTPVIIRTPEPSAAKDPDEEARLKIQGDITKKILLSMADRQIRTLATSPINFISPFVPLGSDINFLIGQNKDPLTRDRKIIEFVIKGIITTIQGVYGKDSLDYTMDERVIASALSHISSNNRLDVRTIIGAVYQDIFHLPIPSHYQITGSISERTTDRKTSTFQRLNEEETQVPAEARIATYIKKLKSERALGMEELSYRERSLLDFLGTFERRVIFEDDHLLVIDKPAGVASHFGSVHPVGIIEASKYVRRRHLYLAHRLDIDTSGVLMLLKTREALEPIKQQFANKAASQMRKIYLAFLEGAINEKGPIKVNRPIAPIAGTIKMRVIDEEDDEDIQELNSETIFFPLVVLSDANGRQNTLTDVQIITGRTHQIRVISAQQLGHPVVGDIMYGGGLNGTGVNRSLLHARELTFLHPFQNSIMTVKAPVPKDFSEYLLTLNWEREIDEDRLSTISLGNGSNKDNSRV